MKTILLACVAASLIPVAAFGQRTGWAPYGSLRGRMTVIEGRSRTVYRARWGNGLTVQGAAVLTNLVNVAGSTASDVLGSREGADTDQLRQDIDRLGEELRQLEQRVAENEKKLSVVPTLTTDTWANELDGIVDRSLTLIGTGEDGDAGEIQRLMERIADAATSAGGADKLKPDERLLFLVNAGRLERRLDSIRQDYKLFLVQMATSAIDVDDLGEDDKQKLSELKDSLEVAQTALDRLFSLLQPGK